MTPNQKKLLVKALLSDWVPLEGSGDYSSLMAMYRKEWVSCQWSISRNTITPAGLEALAENSPPVEIFDDLILQAGRPIARVLPGQFQRVEELISAN